MSEEMEEEVLSVCPVCDRDVEPDDDAVTAFIANEMDWNTRTRTYGGTRPYVEIEAHYDCATRCDWCDELYVNTSITEHHNVNHQDVSVCYSCEEHYGYSCESCSDYIHSDDTRYDEYHDRSLCETCYDDNSCDGLVQGHDYRPSLVYWHKASDGSLENRARPFTKQTLYMGYELETNSSASSIGHAAKHIINVVGADERYMVLKRDGSVSGFEMVSQPATLEAHKELSPWDAIEGLTQFGMTSWRGAGCGLHVHMSKAAFGKDDIYKLLSFHQQNATVIQRFGGRTSDQWASFDVDYGGSEPSKLWLAKGATNYRRYVAVNLQNRHTIELRYFRGSLKRMTVIGVLEFVHTLHEYITGISAVDVFQRGALSWDAYIDWLNKRDNGDIDCLLPLMEKRGVLATAGSINAQNYDDSETSY